MTCQFIYLRLRYKSVTMSKLENIKVPDGIHLDIEAAFDFMDKYLPKKYAREVHNILPEGQKKSLDYIRRVKIYRIKSPVIMIALYRVAQWNKIQNDN